MKELLNRLRMQQGTCISVAVSTERGFQDHKKTGAVLKHALKEVEEKLTEKFDKRDAKPYLEKLEDLMETVDFANSKDGIGFFVNESISEKVDFPFPVTDRVIVDDSFEIRDLLLNLHRMSEYYLLLLSKEQSRLFYGFGTELIELSGNTHTEILQKWGVKVDLDKNSWRMHYGHGGSDDYHLFLEQVDKNLGRYLDVKTLPVLLLGDKESTHYFENHSTRANLIKASMPINAKAQSIPELSKLIEPLLEDLRKAIVVESIMELEDAVGMNKYVAGIENTWKAGVEGRIHKLLVEDGYQLPGYVSQDGYEILMNPAHTGASKHEDMVDDLIENVIDQQGTVLFAHPGSLTKHQKIAAILRY